MTEPLGAAYVYRMLKVMQVGKIALPAPATLALLALVSCAGDSMRSDTGTPDAGSLVCSTPLSLDCQPTFTPSYQNIYDNLLRQTCGAASTGMSCHSAEGAQAGLVLADRTKAYDFLLGNVDGRARVVPGKPECSVIIMRLESTDPNFVMPRGGRLSDGERCAVRQWIARGAMR